MITLVRARLLPRVEPLGDSVLQLRVLPTDLDLNGHMNNGRYLTIMDLGRIDLIYRTGMGAVIRKNGLSAIVGAVTIRFRMSLMPFQRYQLRTRLLCWDEKWFYLEQRFEVFSRRKNGKSKLAAVGLVKGLFRGAEGNLRPIDVVTLLRPNPTVPEIPERIRKWTVFDADATG